VACEAPRSSRLIVHNGADKAKNLLVWRWNSGSVTKEDIGDPTRTTKYALCVYDSLSGSRFRVLSLAVDAGPSWRHATADLWRYSAYRETHEGVTGFLLKTSASGKGKIRFKAEGSRIPLPRAATRSKVFHKDTDVVVQLVNSSTSQCWTSTFATDETDSAEAFMARESRLDSATASRQAGSEPCVPDSANPLTR